MSKKETVKEVTHTIGDTLPKLRAAAVQAAPVFLNRDATVQKVARLTKEAKDNGADLVVFPESFIPTFPLWCLFLPPVDQHPFYKRLFENAVTVPGPAFHELQKIARDNSIFLSVGICEKSTSNFGTMWNTTLLFDREGNMIGHHRKLLPTWGEKLVWSFGDGSSLNIHDTEIGRIGSLICGENSNTLARYNITILICDAIGSLCLLSVYCVGYLAYECALICGCIHVCHLCSKSHDPVINLHIILLLKLILPVIFSYLRAVNPSHPIALRTEHPLMSMNVFCP